MSARVMHTHTSMEERGEDFYPTPFEAVRALMRLENLPETIWEPCCGDGAIVAPLRDAGHTVVATDLIERGCPDSVSGVDFLKRSATPRVGAIVTNPPYKLAREFVEASLEVAPFVAMLLRIQFITSIGRRLWLEQSGLARIHVASRRLPMMHRGGWEGPKNGSAHDHAWFIWDKAAEPPFMQLKLFDWKDFE